MRILVTAFGPFDGRAENASSLALRGLKKAFPGIRTRILPVDMVIAPSRLRDALRRIRPDALVMLGEAAASETIRLETTAWNELDFRIPDIGGRRPPRRRIGRDTPDFYPSTLPLDPIHGALQEAGHRISLSDDPGRYLCNQLFYIARHHIETHSLPCPAGFIHLPLDSDYPTARAVDALALVVEMLSGGRASAVAIPPYNADERK